MAHKDMGTRRQPRLPQHKAGSLVLGAVEEPPQPPVLHLLRVGFPPGLEPAAGPAGDLGQPPVDQGEALQLRLRQHHLGGLRTRLVDELAGQSKDVVLL